MHPPPRQAPPQCRDAPWGVSEAAPSFQQPETVGGRLAPDRPPCPIGPALPPRRRPTGRLYVGEGSPGRGVRLQLSKNRHLVDFPSTHRSSPDPLPIA